MAENDELVFSGVKDIFVLSYLHFSAQCRCGLRICFQFENFRSRDADFEIAETNYFP
jgi:hypothetical protein